MGRYEDLIDAFYALHAEEDESRRGALLEQAIADDVEFYGLQVEAFGREEFARSFRDGGTRLVRTSSVDRRHRWIRCTWELRLPDGTVATSDEGQPYAGLQISELSDDGRLRRIVPFLGNTPPPDD